MYSKMPTELFFQALDGQLITTVNKERQVSSVYRIIQSYAVILLLLVHWLLLLLSFLAFKCVLRPYIVMQNLY